MKKILMMLFLLVTIVGCSCKKEESIKVKVDYEQMPNVDDSSEYLHSISSLLSYELVDLNNYDEKVNNGDSFVLFVYSNSCSGCKLLAPALKAYVDETNLVVYTLNYSKVTDKHELYKAGVNTTPYLVLIENGKIVYVELINLSFSDKEANKDTIREWMNKHVEWGNN